MTFCFAAESLAKSAAVMSGVTPLTSPPIFMANFDPALLAGHDLIYFKLHGLAGQPYWYGDNAATACSAEQLGKADIEGAFVFAANCYGGAKAPMVQALLDAGAVCVATGEGVNYAGQKIAAGADLIGKAWRRMLRAGASAEVALASAQAFASFVNPGLLTDIYSFSVVGNRKAVLKNGVTKSKS